MTVTGSVGVTEPSVWYGVEIAADGGMAAAGIGVEVFEARLSSFKIASCTSSLKGRE